jgi:uncharacterized membrane protein HdeD (DUF308 family)
MTDTAGVSPSPGPGEAAARSDAMSALLARNWWAVLLRGIAAIIFGAIALLMPGVTLATLVLLFAAYMLVDGVLDIVSGIRAARRHERWGLLVLEGVVDIIAGAAAFLVPAAALLVFVALLAVWAMISGGLMFASSFRLNRTHGRLWLIVGGAASVIWGALMLVFPFTGLLVLTWWLGAYAIVFGGSLIILSFRLHSHAAPHAAAPAQPA